MLGEFERKNKFFKIFQQIHALLYIIFQIKYLKEKADSNGSFFLGLKFLRVILVFRVHRLLFDTENTD